MSPRSGNGASRIAICLSGGGFRAALFHLGALRRLNELQILSRVDALSSVSGGSIANAVLATRWKKLKASECDGVFCAFQSLVAQPLMEFCKGDLRTDVLLWDRLNPRYWSRLIRSDYSITDRLAEAYASRLALHGTLDSLPDSPDFVFGSANMADGAPWEFHARTMGNRLAGWTSTFQVSVATAVAASSAFPLVFPPLLLKLPTSGPSASTRGVAMPITVTLTDGGVYDNLGIEPVYESHDAVLVSDAGMPLSLDETPQVHALARVIRSFNLIWNQVGTLRKRWLIDAHQSSDQNLVRAYWGLSSDVGHYGLSDAPGYRGQSLELLKSVRTDLDPFGPGEIACLENHGYALANVAVLRWAHRLLPDPVAPFRWPHPDFVDPAKVATALQGAAERGIARDVWESIKERVGALF
jgi:NTE family protein